MSGSRRENAKVLVKSALVRSGIDLTPRSPMRALARHLDTLGVTSVLDVGANEGQFAQLLRAGGFRGRVVSYEPMRREADIVALKAAKRPEWEIVNAALGASAGYDHINVADNSYSSSLLPVAQAHVAAAPASASSRQERIEIRTLDEEMSRLRLDPATTFVKVDTQGYELEVLRGGDATLPQLPALQLELSLVPLYEGGPTYDEVYPWLRERGWRLWSLEPGFTSPTGEMLQCDGIFVRE